MKPAVPVMKRFIVFYLFCMAGRVCSGGPIRTVTIEASSYRRLVIVCRL